MVVESFTEHNVSLASDVWSFGILMWELFNPGLSPYHVITNNAQVIASVVAIARGVRSHHSVQRQWYKL